MVVGVVVVAFFETEFVAVSAQSGTGAVDLGKDPTSTVTGLSTCKTNSAVQNEACRTLSTHIVGAAHRAVSHVAKVTKTICVLGCVDSRVTCLAGGQSGTQGTVRQRTGLTQERRVDEESGLAKGALVLGQNVCGPGGGSEDGLVLGRGP